MVLNRVAVVRLVIVLLPRIVHSAMIIPVNVDANQVSLDANVIDVCQAIGTTPLKDVYVSAQ